MRGESFRNTIQVPKCKELLIQFKKTRSSFPSVWLNSGSLSLVRHSKILGLTVTDNLKLSKHVTEIIKKANKRVFFIVPLKQVKLPAKEILNFYWTCVRPVLGYGCEVFHFTPPEYPSVALERVQRRITWIVFPGLPYIERLEKGNAKMHIKNCLTK